MTLHPQHLHALAALHSLAAAWPHLLRAELAARTAPRSTGDLGTLRSPVYGTVRSSGPARSAVAEAVVAYARADTWVPPETRLLDSAAGTVRWLAADLGASRPAVPDSLIAMAARVPVMHPRGARDLGLWIAEQDHKIREHLRLGSDRAKLTGVACPACRTRRIEVRVSNPDLDARPYVCGAGCTCAGEGCGCGMGVLVEGVDHIWLRGELVAAVKEGTA